MDYDDLHTHANDPDAVKQIYSAIVDCVRVNERGNKALRLRIDLIVKEGLGHRHGRMGWDEVAETLYTRFGIPPIIDRKDADPSSFWRPWVKLHIAPLPKYFDESSHPRLIALIGKAC